jgi:DNA-binding MarR family transcriptional regulator
MSQKIPRLAGGAYVERGSDPLDGRKVLLSITEAGRAELSQPARVGSP